MFNLNEAILSWRQTLADHPGFRAGDLDELEDHLRAEIAELQAHGLSEEEGFLVASRRLGKPADLGAEFAIADPDSRRRFRLRWMVTGALALVFLWLGSGFIIGLGAGALGWVAGGGAGLPVLGAGLMIALLRVMVLLAGGLLLWKMLATDGSSRRLGSLGAGSILGAALLLAFLVLAVRLVPGFLLVHSFGQPGLMHWSVAGAWVNLLLLLLLPAVLLIALWKLVRG